MTGSEFKTWLKGYLEGVRSGSEPNGNLTQNIKRIEEEAEKIDVAPVTFAPYVAPFVWPPDQTITVIGDCGCDPNKVCGSSACPRALRCNFPSTSCIGSHPPHDHVLLS
jgi:hypothetical protein